MAQVYGLVETEAVIGRAEDCAVVLQGDGTISRRHARITLHGGQAVITDMASLHGTFINGQQITQPTLLRSGDVVRVGQTVRFEV